MSILKKIFTWSLAIVVIIYLLFITIVPPLFEQSRNNTALAKPYIVSAAAKSMLDSFDFIGDLHCDALLWDRNLNKKAEYGHVDFPRMREGKVAFQAFTIVTKSPKGQNFNKNSAEAMDMITPLCIGQGQPPNTWFSLINRALYQCKKLHRFEKKSDENFIVVKSKSDFERLLVARKSNRKVVGGLLGIEGGHCLEGEMKNVAALYKAGVRMLGPTHFFDNEMGGSAHGEKKGGLTAFGKEVLSEMATKGMIVDVAHSSERLIDDVLTQYSGPILSSHTGVDGTYPSSRNLSDKHLRALAQRGGLIGIAFFPDAVGSNGIPDIVKAMKYTKNLIGVDHVALGSDFDGSVTTPFDITGLGLLVDEMISHGFSRQEIKAIFGDNLKRFLLKHLPNN